MSTSGGPSAFFGACWCSTQQAQQPSFASPTRPRPSPRVRRAGTRRPVPAVVAGRGLATPNDTNGRTCMCTRSECPRVLCSCSRPTKTPIGPLHPSVCSARGGTGQGDHAPHLCPPAEPAAFAASGQRSAAPHPPRRRRRRRQAVWVCGGVWGGMLDGASVTQVSLPCAVDSHCHAPPHRHTHFMACPCFCRTVFLYPKHGRR